MVVILDHAKPNRLHLFTLSGEFETGANHIVEALLWFLVERKRTAPLPRKLFVQVDNCIRENKNSYFMSFLESLVEWGIFDEIKVGSLPIGHTHEDVDKSFSTTSSRMKRHNAITHTYLHTEVRHTSVSYTHLTLPTILLV